jgi:hypothetical protein
MQCAVPCMQLLLWLAQSVRIIMTGDGYILCHKGQVMDHILPEAIIDQAMRPITRHTQACNYKITKYHHVSGYVYCT